MASIGTLFGILTLKSDQYERNMRRAEQVTTKFRNETIRLAAQFVTIQTVWRGFTAGIRHASALTDMAEQTQTNIEHLQGLISVTRDAGAKQDTLRQALSKLITTAEDAASGNKEYAQSFKALNVDINHFLSLPTERRFEMLAKGYAQATNKSEAYRAVTRLLGEDSGPRLLEVLRRVGTDGLDSVTEKARRAGEVLMELDAQRLDHLSDTFEQWKTRSLVAIDKVIVGWQVLISKLRTGAMDNVERAAIDAQVRAAREIQERPGRTVPAGKSPLDFSNGMWQKNGLTDYQLNSAFSAGEIREIKNEAEKAKIGASWDEANRDRTSQQLDATLRIQREVDAAFKEIDAASDAHLQELESYGASLSTALMTPWEKLQHEIPKLNAAYNAGFITAETANRRIAELEADIAERGKKVNAVAQELGMAFTNAFENAIFSGQKFGDVLKALAQDLLRMLLMRTLIEPLVGGIVGGIGKILGFADGGSPPVGKVSIVGERGPELFVPATAGTIIPNHKLAVGGGGGGDSYFIDARGADSAAISRLEDMIRGLHGSFEQRAVSAVIDAQRRGRIR